jgi:uncharacterized OB-fold protein
VEWRQLSGRGRIISRVVVHDTPTSSLIPEQPFNVAAIALDEEPAVIMLSHLPGTPVDQVPRSLTTLGWMPFSSSCDAWVCRRFAT